jgi:aryl-alcohol dehydrogenase-like predicted oxidoreductase
VSAIAARRLGAGGPEVCAIGLGCMGMSGVYGPADDAESVATIHAALDAGVALLDTGDFYGMGHNEMLIRDALRARRREEAIISVKFGALRGPDNRWAGSDCRPAAVRNFLAYTLRRLGTDHVDVYRPARVDPDVPIEETVGAIAELVQAGYVRQIGLSEVGADTLRRAHSVHPICDVQIEYSLLSRGPEEDLLPACNELGVAVTAYGVLSRGLLGGHLSAGAQAAQGDFRAHAPRFTGPNLEHNLELVERLRAIAAEGGRNVAQLAIAWVLARDPGVVALVGAHTRERLADALEALGAPLDSGTLARLDEAFPAGVAAGSRYPEAGMAQLERERRG